MASAVVVFDFDKTILDCDVDEWLSEKMGVSQFFSQLLPTISWNSAMDRVMTELHSKGTTIQDISECLKQVPMPPRIVSAIRSAHAFGCDLRILSDASVFAIETVLRHNGLIDFFSEINTNPSHVDVDGRLRILPYHDFKTSSPHGCTICPPNMCKGMVMERIRASVSGDRKKRFIYVGDGASDFCASLRLEEGDFMMPRKKYPFCELLCTNRMLTKATIRPWSNEDDFEAVLLTLIKTICIEENCRMRPDPMLIPSRL
uniref:Uncharacterized protein n=1 Tax=Rhizophora mucronata TaxID=61149 RepID=A0A2P2NIE5_RHIMU